MRLSPARVVVRAALLAFGGAYMLWRAFEAREASRGLAGGEALLGSRLALVWGLVGVLSLLTAAAAALSLRRRVPRRTLRLGSPPGQSAPGRAHQPAVDPSAPARRGAPR